MRRQLALVALAVTSMVVVAFIVPLGLLVRSQAESRALNRAQQAAQTIATAIVVTTSGGADPAASATGALAAFAGTEQVSVLLPDDSVVGAPMDVGASVARARTGRAFAADTDTGAEVLIPVFTEAEAPLIVRAFVTSGELGKGVGSAWLRLAALGAFLIGFSVFVADRLARIIIRPIADLAEAAHRLGEGDLSTRVESGGPPEIREVGRAFNHLAGRLRDLLTAERESVADLSHRLRTPLTAMRLEAEGLSSPGDAGRLLEHVERLETAVTDLIEEARSPSEDTPRSVHLDTIVRHRSDFWRVLAEDQGRPFELQIAADMPAAHVTLEEAAVLVDTLFENVFAHTPPATPFSVSLDQRNGRPTLSFSDGGPGFADPSVLDRGSSGAGSTGLGLDIVRRTAERSGGGVRLARSDLGGALVEVTLGPA